MKKIPQTEKLLGIVARLRKECPWDRKQTHRSLLPYLLEEAYETAEAIRDKDPQAMKEELGDLLLQVVLHCEIASEVLGFDFEDVARGIGDKMVRRHPHVFAAGASAKSKKDHSRQWTEMKAQEKPKKSLLEGTPRSMPALQLAQRYGEISSSVGFDWEDEDGVWAKLEEELEELRHEIKARSRNRKRVAEELGDVAFCLANLARHLGLNAEDAGREAAVKFSRRFAKMEAQARKGGARLAAWSPEDWERAWNKAKTSR